MGVGWIYFDNRNLKSSQSLSEFCSSFCPSQEGWFDGIIYFFFSYNYVLVFQKKNVIDVLHFGKTFHVLWAENVFFSFGEKLFLLFMFFATMVNGMDNDPVPLAIHNLKTKLNNATETDFSQNVDSKQLKVVINVLWRLQNKNVITLITREKIIPKYMGTALLFYVFLWVEELRNFRDKKL